MINRKTILSAAVVTAMGGVSFSASAALTSSAVLDFDLGTQQIIACAYGSAPPCNKASYQITDVVGSYFIMDTNGNGPEASEKTGIGSLNGIHLGTTQAAGGSHAGGINGTESPNIDNPWTFFGGTGMHQTTSPIVDLGGGVMDFSGWNVTWNGIASIPLTEEIFDADGNLIGPTITTIACDTNTCSDSSNYTIDGTFHVAGAGFTTVAYFLHLEGHVSNPTTAPIPVPAAAWLFGSGLLGLAGVARRRKSKK